jgi:hypothetical protein
MNYINDNISNSVRSILFEEENDYFSSELEVKPNNAGTDKIGNLLSDKDNKIYNTLDKSNTIKGLDKINNFERYILSILDNHSKGNEISKKFALDNDYGIESKFKNKIDKINMHAESLAKSVEQLYNEHHHQSKYIKYAMKPIPDDLTQQEDNQSVVNVAVQRLVSSLVDLSPKKYIVNGNENKKGISWTKKDKDIVLNSLKTIIMSEINNNPPYNDDIKQELKDILGMFNDL